MSVPSSARRRPRPVSSSSSRTASARCASFHWGRVSSSRDSPSMCSCRRRSLSSPDRRLRSRAAVLRARVARVADLGRGQARCRTRREDLGDDLRIEGVVVEPLGGLDDVADKLEAFGPDRDHRVGVLADHLVNGTKIEDRRGGPRRSALPRRRPHHRSPLRRYLAGGETPVVGIREWPVVPAVRTGRQESSVASDGRMPTIGMLPRWCASSGRSAPSPMSNRRCRVGSRAHRLRHRRLRSSDGSWSAAVRGRICHRSEAFDIPDTSLG